MIPSPKRFAAALLAMGALLIGGCGAAPRDEDIFHRPELRPSVVEAGSPAEQELLQRLRDAPEGETEIRTDGVAFSLQPVYAAASGRSCRRIQAPSSPRRVACQDLRGRWVYVPPLEDDGEAE